MAGDLIPAGILADLQATVNRSLVDAATNGRTAANFPCRVTADTRDVHLEGLPSIMRVRRWKIAAGSTNDVRLGDVLTVVDALSDPRGTYRVLELEHPRSLLPGIEAYCLMIADAAGNPPLVTNASVTFTSGTTNQQVTVGAVIFAVTNTEHLMAFAEGWDWGVVFDGRTSYGNGDHIAYGDTVLWAGLQRPVPVSNPHAVPDIPNEVVMFFKEQARGRA